MKKRMRQLTALILSVMLVLGGCKGQTEDTSKDTMDTESQEEPVESEEDQEKAEEKIPLSVKISPNQKTYYSEDGERPYFDLQYCDVTVEGSDYENLKRNVENWSLKRSESLRSFYTSLEENAGEEAEEKDGFEEYGLVQTVSAVRVDDRIVSLLDDTYQYTGGDHGSFYREGINFDTQRGKQLTLQEVITDYENFTVEAKERIVSELRANYEGELFEDYLAEVEDLWQEGAEPQWYLDATGIVLVLQEYSVGPYTMGTPEIHLPYEEFEHYIRDAYLPSVSDGVARIEKNQELYLELAGLSEKLPMMIKYEEREDASPSCSLWLGDHEQRLEEFVAFRQAYLVKNTGQVYCLIQVDMGSDDCVTSVYRLTDGVPEETARIDASVDPGNMNSHEIVMESWINLLGTYGGTQTYTFDEKGGLSTDDTTYLLENNTRVLTTTAELPVMLGGVESTLPAGSHIVLNATDNETYVTFTIQETGQTGVLGVSRGQEDFFEVTIDGKDQYECFEELPYAG